MPISGGEMRKQSNVIIFLTLIVILLLCGKGYATDIINFNDHTIMSYGGSQDGSGIAVVENGGGTLHLIGNLWKCIALSYNITPGTILEFDFQSDTQGEEHSIGMDSDLNVQQENRFKLYGVQDDSGKQIIIDYKNYASHAPNSHHYTIPIGQYYTGQMAYLFFASDHDIASPIGEAVFSNVTVYEQAGGLLTPDPMGWEVVPHLIDSLAISMTATTASAPDGVQYYFTCISDSSHDSNWQDSPVYIDTDLELNIEYIYSVKARDKSPELNETAASAQASVIVPAFIIIDDFESYYGNSRHDSNPVDGKDLLLQKWKDGSANATQSEIWPYAEGYLEFACNNSQSPYYSKVTRTWLVSQYWAETDLGMLSLCFKGDFSVDTLTVELYDNTDKTASQTIDDLQLLEPECWHKLNFKLSGFSDLDFTAITKIEIVIGQETAAAPEIDGKVVIDDIMLCPYDCTKFLHPGDINGDCIVNVDDLVLLSNKWLSSGYDVDASLPDSTDLEAYYALDDSTGTVALDSSGNSRDADVITTAQTTSIWNAAGHENGCIRFDGTFYLELPESIFAAVDQQVTILFWLYDELAVWPTYDEAFIFEAGAATKDQLIYNQDHRNPISHGWNHYAYVKDVTADIMKLYKNGVLIAQDQAASLIIDGPNAGKTIVGQDATGLSGYNGNMDELIIYSRALTHQEIVSLAAISSVHQPLLGVLASYDPMPDDKIDLKDLAILANKWLDDNTN